MVGGYWQQRLVEMAKRDGKPIDTIDAELEQAMASGLGFFISKEELARCIVEANEQYAPVQAAAEPAQPEQPAKKTDKAPYYHKNKREWWK